MARAFSSDLRARVITASQAQQSNAEIARSLQVSEAWVHKVLAHYRATGEVQPRHNKRGPKFKLAAADHERLTKTVQARPDATLAELRQTLKIKVGMATLWRALDELGFTFKKSPARSRTKTA